MKVTVVGYKPYDFKDQGDGRQVQGISLFVTHADPTQEDLKGHTIAKYGIKGGTELYNRMMAHKWERAFEADADVMVSNNKAVLMDLRFGTGR